MLFVELIFVLFGLLFFGCAGFNVTFSEPRKTPNWLALAIACWFILAAALPVFVALSNKLG